MTTRPTLSVLYTSGYTGQAVGHGVIPERSHFISKPFTREELARKVREALSSTYGAWTEDARGAEASSLSQEAEV
jgi:hypothetical protein